MTPAIYHDWQDEADQRGPHPDLEPSSGNHRMNPVIIGNATLYNGDCLEVLKTLPANSVEACLTDPPYGLSAHSEADIRRCMAAWLDDKPYVHGGAGFMGKSWDSFVPGPEMWRELYRILKPGAHLLVFAGTRTADLMSLALRLAGFENRDLVLYTFGSGFPKSLNVRKSIQNNAVDICKLIDNFDIIEEWKNYSKTVKHAGVKFQKSLTEIGMSTLKNDSALINAAASDKLEKSNADAIIAELNLKERHHISKAVKTTAQENAEATIRPLPSLATTAGNKSQSQNPMQPIATFIVENLAQILHSEKMQHLIRAEEVLMTWNGKKKCLDKADINALCAALTEDLKRIILSQSRIFQSLDTTQQTECVSAINVTTTEYMAECLISNMADTLKRRLEKANKALYSEWDGWLSALKPAYEPILLFRKPLDGTIAANTLKWGCGGLNVGACRVDTEEITGWMGTGSNGYSGGLNKSGEPRPIQGRYPANLILSSDEEVERCFPVTVESKQSFRGLQHSGRHGGLGDIGGNIKSDTNSIRGHNDSGGSASRFFQHCDYTIEEIAELNGIEPKRIVYSGKASKLDRDEGCNELDEVIRAVGPEGHTKNFSSKSGELKRLPRHNHHATVKPTALLRYLLKLITPPGATVIDPFLGSGSTAKAALLEGFNVIGIEREPDYFEICQARVAYVAPEAFTIQPNASAAQRQQTLFEATP